MKEREFGRNPEGAPAHPLGLSRGATVARLRRPAKSEKLDVDELVTDFLQVLEAYAAAAQAAESIVPAVPRQQAPEPESPDQVRAGAPFRVPDQQVAPSSARALHTELDAELEQSLLEIESHPVKGVTPAPISDIAATLPPSPGTSETAQAPEPSADQPPAISSAQPMAYPEAEPVIPVRIAAKPIGRTDWGPPRLSLSLTADGSAARRRLVIGFAVLAAAAAICLAVYLASLMKSALTGMGSGMTASRAAVTSGAAPSGSVPPDRKVFTEVTPAKERVQALGDVRPAPVQSARTGLPPANPRPAGPATRDDNVRAKTPAPSRTLAQSRIAETDASTSAKQSPAPRDEILGGKNAAVIPAQSSAEASAGAGNKTTESVQIPPPVTSPVVTAPAKADNELPEIPKIPPAGTVATSTDPPDAAKTTASSSAAGGEPAPIATPAEAVVRVTPIYPVTARNMRVSGTVDVRVSIDERGKVTKAAAINGPQVLREAAEDALRKWKFKPATLRGENIRSEIVISVSFTR